MWLFVMVVNHILKLKTGTDPLPRVFLVTEANVSYFPLSRTFHARRLEGL